MKATLIAVIGILVLGGIAITAWHYEQVKQQQRIEAEKREAEKRDKEKYDQLSNWLKEKNYLVEKLENGKRYRLSYKSSQAPATDTSAPKKLFIVLYGRFNGNLSMTLSSHFSTVRPRRKVTRYP